jgi:hypothetical protein
VCMLSQKSNFMQTYTANTSLLQSHSKSDDALEDVHEFQSIEYLPYLQLICQLEVTGRGLHKG